MITNKNVFITGGAGFIGSTIARELLDNNKVTIFDNFTRESKVFLDIRTHKNLTIVEGSILDFDSLKNSLGDSNIIIHCAAIAGIDSVIKSPTNTMRVNVIGTYNILEAANQSKNELEKVLIFSTSEVFGSSAYKVDESSNIDIGEVGEARWTYAVSKLSGEHFASSYFSEFDLPIVIVRPFNIYGPGQIGVGAMNKFISKALKNENIEIYGDGNQIRSWCYVDDFINSLLLIISNSDIVGQSINIGNSRQVLTIYGLAEAIIRVLESKSKILFKEELSADIEMRVPTVDKLIRVIGYSPNTSLEDGILLTAKYIQNEK
jgi:UDP-glucose 4-epimerase